MKIWLAGICALVLVSGATSAWAGEDDPQQALLASRIEAGIAQLTASIEGLDKRMADLERPPDRAASTFNDLQALDLSAWRLRRQQWVLQRDHLTLARELLRQAVEHPDQRARLGEQWADHERAYFEKLDAMRQERYALERERLQAEARLIGQFLR